MGAQRSGWEQQLKEAPFTETGFTEELKRKTRGQWTERRPRRRKLTFPAAVAGAIALFALMLYMLPWGGVGSGEHPSNEARGAYDENGELLLDIFPDPELAAGRTFGYIFHFPQLQMDEVIGMEMAIRAVHAATGQNVTAMPPTVIEEYDAGYQSMQRFTARFALPLGGIWRYEVILDGDLYASSELLVAEPDWSLSGSYTLNIRKVQSISADRNTRAGALENEEDMTHSYKLTGVQDEIGFINPGFIAGQPNKYMWFVQTPIRKDPYDFHVKAVKQGSYNMIDVINVDGADGMQLPSSMILPEAGIWRLLPFVNERLVESIVVEVKEQ